MAEYIIQLKEHHYQNPGKDRLTDIGLAIDACLKEQAAVLGGVEADRFAPYDYELDGTLHEIKSTAGTWLSIPNSEVEFAQLQLQAGREVVYDVVQQIDLRSARFLGSAAFSQFSHLIEPSKFLTWRLYPDGWKQERSHRVLLVKLKPILA
jgi:hypothetical protein